MLDRNSRFFGNHPTPLVGLPEPSHPLLQQFLDYWLRRKEDRPLPRKSDIDPADIKACLPNVWIYRYEPNPGTFRCTLAGEEIQQAWGHGVIGKDIVELFGATDAEALLHRWQYALQRPAILHSVTGWIRDGKRVERLSTPWSDGGGKATHIFGISVFAYSEPASVNAADPTINPDTRYYVQD